MPAKVRATCPGCRTVLRIPAEWADRAVRCKKCGAVVQAKPKSAPVAAPAAAPAKAVPAKPVAESPTLPIATPVADSPAAPPAAAPVQLPVAQPVPAADGSGAAPVYAPPAYPGQPVAAYPYPPQPAAWYPTPAPAAFPELDSPIAFDTPRRYRRRSGIGQLLGAGFLLLLAVGLGGAGVYFGLPYLKKVREEEQANAGTTAPPQVEPKAGPPPKAVAAVFPRRMLVMSVTRYLYCNSLTAGKGNNGSDHVSEVARRLAFDWRVPLDADTSQLFVLSDTAPKDARPMLKPIVEAAYREFCETSRPQDRVFLYFGGHAFEKDGKAYLVPSDGDLTDPATLIPLDDFWAKVRDCKAQQKVVVFDVCRVNEDGDKVRPGSEPMTEALERKLLAAPPGVQAVTTCSAGQNALEFRRTPTGDGLNDVAGSLFLSAMRYVADKRKAGAGGAAKPEDPLAIAQWVGAAAARVKEVTGRTDEPEQTPKLAGTEGPTVAFNPDEPPAKRFDLPAAPKGVPPAELAKITARIHLPPIRPNRSTEKAEAPLETVVPFAESTMKPLMPDGVTDEEILKDAEKYPVRKAAIEALKAIRESWRALEEGDKNREPGIRDRFSGQTSDAVKKLIMAEQETPARIILTLEDQVTAMEAVAGQLDKEESKYWKATFLYAQAQAKARLAFMNEYNLALGNIRTDSLPERDEKKGQVGLQLVSVEKMKSKKEYRDLADSAKELFTKLADEYKGTPWAVQAKRDRVIALGLEWRPYSEGGKLAE